MKGGHFSSSDKITLLPFGHHQHHHHRHHAEDPLAAGPDLEEQRHGPEEEEEEEEEDARSIASLVHVRSPSKDFRKLWVISLLLTMCLTLLVVFSLLWLGGMFNESMGRKGFIDNTSRWSGPEQRGETKEKIGENIEEQDEEESDKQSRREKDYDHESTTTTTASLSGLYELSHFSPDFDDYLRSLSIPEFLFPFIKNTTEHVEVQEPTEGSRVWHIRHTCKC